MFSIKYVISDVHGEFDKFLEMLELIEFGDSDKLYILGDIVDRGSKSLEIIEFCMQNENNIELLLGNHEDLMLSYYAGEADQLLWFLNGGGVTYRSFEKLSTSKKLNVLNFLETRALGKIVNSFILVHAGISPVEDSLSAAEVLEKQSKKDLLWIREEFINCPTGLDNYTVIFGHTPTPYIFQMWYKKSPNPFMIWHDTMYGGDKIGIDCGIVARDRGGRLGALRLDDMKEFYVH